MPEGFLPLLGVIGSSVISSLLAPKPPKPPSPVPAPPPPAAAPLPTPPTAPTAAQEPTISPEDAMAAQKASQNRAKLLAAQAQQLPGTGNATDISNNNNVSIKTLLGE